MTYDVLNPRRKWMKLPEETIQNVTDWILNSHFLVPSPRKDDTVKIRKDDGSYERVASLLLTYSVRELHNEILNAVPGTRDANGKSLL